jgi:outer membrane protein assembly factor BamB
MSRARRACAGMAGGVWAVAAGLLAAAAVVDGRSPPRLLWHVSGHGRGTPVRDDDRVYALSIDHQVLAFAADSGRIAWRAPTGGSGTSTGGSRLVLAGPLVIAGDDGVVGIERGSGRVVWRFRPRVADAPGMYLGEAAGGLVFAGSVAGQLYGINAATGLLRWRASVGDSASTVVGAPIVSGDAVVAGFTVFGETTGGGVVAVDAATGHERWRRRFPTPRPATVETGPAGGPVATGDLVVVGRRDGVVESIDRRTGLVRWSVPPVRPLGRLADEVRHDFRALAVAGRALVMGSLTGQVTAVDVAAGRVRWRVAASATSAAFSMAAAGRMAYVPFMSGEIVAFDVGTGVERWRIGGGDRPFRWSPLVAGDRLYAVSTRAGYFAFAL